MERHLFYTGSLWAVLTVLSIVLATTAVVGYCIGQRARQRGVDQSQTAAIQGSTLGLLALMLGFTFGAASARYDTRRELMIAEANAIGTTFLRAQTLPQPYRDDLSDMLGRYVDLRLRSLRRLDRPGELKNVQRDTSRLQRAMWAKAAAVSREHPSDITGLFEESLNESIDLFSSRVASFTMRVPDVIMWVLALIAVVALGMVGYGFGVAGQHGWLIMALLSFVVALVIVMIVDLDRPEAGPTRVSQQTMIDLKQSIADYPQGVR